MSIIVNNNSMTRELLPNDTTCEASPIKDYAVYLDEKQTKKRRFLKWTIISVLIAAVLVLSTTLALFLTAEKPSIH